MDEAEIKQVRGRAKRLVLDWENRALQELYREYAHTLNERKLTIRPAALELFDSNTHWGQWVSEIRTIRLSRKLLMTKPWHLVLGVLKHEMAHQMVDEDWDRKNHADQKVHGESFRSACDSLGLPPYFSRASLDLQSHFLDWREEKTDNASEKLLEKVRKLLALATSTNEHEALMAMNRVREIYARHNLEQIEKHQEPSFYHIVIDKGSKRIETYEKKIIGILVGHFFVQVIVGQNYDVTTGEHHRSIEIIGTRESALMAEYVYHFLRQQTEHLLQQAIKEDSRSFSRVARNSFRLGILTGFAKKLEEQERASQRNHDLKSWGAAALSSEENSVSRALALFHRDKKLDRYIARVYPRLRTLSSGRQLLDPSAYNQGQAEGRKITLNRPISKTSSIVPGRLSGRRASSSSFPEV